MKFPYCLWNVLHESKQAIYAGNTKMLPVFHLNCQLSASSFYNIREAHFHVSCGLSINVHVDVHGNHAHFNWIDQSPGVNYLIQ